VASSAVYDELIAALRERLEVIGDAAGRSQDPDAHLDRLKDVSKKIDEISAQLPADIDPRLDHFLKRCSYDKALAMLEMMGSG
jgi:hypothetical protein